MTVIPLTPYQAGGPVQPRDGRAGKHREGILVAFLCPLYEVSLVHGRSAFDAAHMVAFGC